MGHFSCDEMGPNKEDKAKRRMAGLISSSYVNKNQAEMASESG